MKYIAKLLQEKMEHFLCQSRQEITISQNIALFIKFLCQKVCID